MYVLVFSCDACKERLHARAIAHRDRIGEQVRSQGFASLMRNPGDDVKKPEPTETAKVSCELLAGRDGITRVVDDGLLYIPLGTGDA